MADNNVSRRRVLQGVAAGAAATGLAGQAAADKPDVQGHIIGLEPGAPRGFVRKEADEIYEEMDFERHGQALAGRFPEEALNGLRNHPKVDYVEEDQVKFHALGQTLPWGIDRVDADKLHADGSTGNGADIAILDTGIDDDHPDLQANVQGGKAFGDIYCGSAGGGCRFGGSPNDNSCNYEWSDDNNHGTHCAGIADAVNNSEDVVGVSTEANLWAGKVLDGCGSGSLSAIASGIEWAADQGFDVASMSLGASSGDSTLKNAVQYGKDKGLLMVAAAGNDGPCTDCVGYPAAYSEVIAVSSTASDDSLSDFSSTGPEVELAAPGTDILSTVPPESSSNGTDTYSGTSMACPHVSGAAGQVMADGTSASTARTTLQDTAEDIGLASNEQGYGLLDAEAAAGGSSSNSSPTVDSLSISEVETSDSDAEFDVSWQVGDADGNLSTVDITLTDDTAGSQEDSASISVSGSSASGTTRLVAASDDGSGNSYTASLTVTDGSGATASGSTSTSETEDTNSSPTVDSLSASEVETSDGDAEFDVSWQVGDADGNLSSVDLTLTDDSDGTTEDTASISVSGSSASGTTRLVAASDDGSGHGYTVSATVTDGSGATGSGSTSVSETESTSSAPAIDSYSVTEAGSPNPHAEITADWAVSDSDGDLSSVDVEVFDSSGNLVDSASNAVSGSSASGSNSFKIKQVRGQTFDVTTTVTDSKGNTDSATQTVTE